MSVSIRRAAFVQGAGRWDAKYYQGKYDEAEGILAQHEIVLLGDAVDMQKSIEPGSNAYKDSGVPFIRVQDLSEHGIEPPSVFLDEAYYDEALALKKDTVLFSKDGSIGIAYKVDEDTKAITSGALLHLTVKDKRILPDYLALYLNSIAVKMLGERDAGGSIIRHWKPSEIKRLPLPLLPDPVQQRIAQAVQEAASLRRESAALLEEAKRAVEREIEGQ